MGLRIADRRTQSTGLLAKSSRVRGGVRQGLDLSRRAGILARDAGLGKSGIGWCRDGWSGRLAGWPEGVEAGAVYAVSSERRAGLPDGTPVWFVSRRTGWRNGLDRRAGIAPASLPPRLQGGARCLHGDYGQVQARSERIRAYRACQGLTTGLTRAVVPLPLPPQADSVSGAVRALGLTGVEAK